MDFSSLTDMQEPSMTNSPTEADSLHTHFESLSSVTSRTPPLSSPHPTGTANRIRLNSTDSSLQTAATHTTIGEKKGVVFRSPAHHIRDDSSMNNDELSECESARLGAGAPYLPQMPSSGNRGNVNADESVQSMSSRSTNLNFSHHNDDTTTYSQASEASDVSSYIERTSSRMMGPSASGDIYGHEIYIKQNTNSEIEESSHDTRPLAEDDFHPDQTTPLSKIICGRLCTCYCCGKTKTPNWHRVAAFVVRQAPCFWCCACCCGSGASVTDRAILFRLNILCSIMAVVQVASGVFLFVVQMPIFFEDLTEDVSEEVKRDGIMVEIQEESTGILNLSSSFALNMWNLTGNIFSLAFVGLILAITATVSLRVIKVVNLIGALRYYWFLMWILPTEILLVVSLFDYHRVTVVWVRHWWNTQSFDYIRYQFCANGTANLECRVPELGGEFYENVTELCESQYNSTDCENIIENAQDQMITYSTIFFTANAIWGLVLVAMVFLALVVLERIISSPIVQSSTERNIPAWLALPIVGSCIMGYILKNETSTLSQADSGVGWVGTMFYITSGMFFGAAILGCFTATSVYNQRDKQRKKAAVNLFILMIIITIFLVGAIFANSLVYSVGLVDNDLGGMRGTIACRVDTANSCTSCSTDDDNLDEEIQCVEWSKQDVTKILQTQLKQSATVAAIFLLYAFSALRFGFVLRTHVSMYQIDYL